MANNYILEEELELVPETDVTVFDNMADPNEVEKTARQVYDLSVEYEVPVDSVEKSYAFFKDGEDFIKNFEKVYNIPWERKPLPPIITKRLFKETGKGAVRFLESAGGFWGGTTYDWLGQFIEQGGYAIDWFSRLGAGYVGLNKNQIYNPYAQAIIATGQNISAWGKDARERWVYEASTGWEKLDESLRKTDPVAYGAGRLTEGVMSSALSVLSMYLSGGASAGLLNQGFEVNRGLVALSLMSAGGGYEHAQRQGENFYWSTLQGLADGMIEYAMETSFLDDVGKGGKALTAGRKEAMEEFFTGMMQNTRAIMLENQKKGLSAYDAAKDAIVKSLKQSPWEVAAGFIGGYGIQGGAILVNIVENSYKGIKEGELEPDEIARLAKLKEDYERIVSEGGPEQMRKLRERLQYERELDIGIAEPVAEKPPAKQPEIIPVESEAPAVRPYSMVLEPKDLKTVKGSVFHGTMPQEVISILNKGEIKPNVSRGDKLGQKVISMSRYKKAADDFGIVTFEIKDKGYKERPQAVKGDYIEGLEVVSNKPIPLSDIKAAHITLGSEETLDWKHPSGITLRQLKEQIESKGIPVKIYQIKPTVLAKQAPAKPTVVEQTKAEQRDILGGVDPINQIHIALQNAKEVQPLTEAEKKATLRKRVAKYAGTVKGLIKKGMPTEQAIFKATGVLKGQLTDYERVYEPIDHLLTPEVKESLAQKIYTHPGLKPLEIHNITESFAKLKQGYALTPGDVQNIERVFGKAFEDVTDSRETRSGLYDRLITLWKAGLLTGIKTSGLNTLANASHAMTETAKDIPAAFVDSVASLFTNERTLAFTARGSFKGVKEGFVKGWKYLRTGVDERNIAAKYDYKRTNFGKTKRAKAQQAYTDFIFHLLGAEDQPFYYGAKARSISNQAIAKAKTKKLKGKAFDDYVDNLIQNPTDDMLEWSTYDAEIAVFQNKTMAGDFAKTFQNLPVLGQVIVPFGRTPAAVATQIVHYTPAGLVLEISNEIHKGQFNQRKFSQAFGRSTVGTAALYIGTQLFKAGLLALDYPKTEKERELWKAEGRTPNSIKIGDKWRSIFVLGPVGNVLLIGGHFQKMLDQEGSPTKAFVTACAGGAKSFSEQTFVRGVNMAIDALVDPEKSFENWFSNMAGSMVPTIVGDFARANDEIERRAVGPFEKVQKKIPYAREFLEPAVDVFGQDLPRYGGNILESMIDPSRPSKIRQDIVVDELRRLWDNKIRVSPTRLGDKKGYDILTDEENTQLWRRAGDIIYKRIFEQITNESYRSLDDFSKGRLIEIAVISGKDEAKAEMVKIKLAQGKTPLELAESGLLTIESLEMLKYYGEEYGEEK